jgi:hypothetical protein
VESQEGILDLLSFEAPRDWGERLDNVFHHDHRLADSLNDHHVVVWPPRPIRGTGRLEFRATIPDLQANGFVVPCVRLTGVERVEQIIVLPRKIDGWIVEWSTNGLTTTDLPDQLPDVPSDVVAYRAEGESCMIRGRTRADLDGHPRVSLADHFLLLGSADQFEAVSVLHVDPNGSPSGAVQIPNGCQLVQLLVGGISRPAMRDAGGETLTVDFPDAFLPQRMEVVFRGNLGVELPAARLTGAAPDETLWTLEIREESVSLRLKNSMRVIDADQYHARTFRHLARLLLDTQTRLRHVEPGDARHWLESWREPLEHHRDHVLRRLARPMSRTDEAVVQFRAVEAELDALPWAADTLNATTQTTPSLAQSPAILRRLLLTGRSRYLVSTSGVPRVDVIRPTFGRAPSSSRRADLPRWATTAALVLLAVATAWLPSRVRRRAS